MAESLGFDIFAIDRASEVFRKVGDHAEEMGSRMGKIGKAVSMAFVAIGAAGLGAAAVIAKTGLDELKNNQVSVAQLNAVIKSTSGVAGTTTAAMQKLAMSVQSYSGQTHESVQQSAALLLGFTNIKDAAGAGNNILDRTVTLTADMAARMGGAASDNAIKLGKALNDPTKGMASLARVGIQFTASQTAQIKAMQKSGDLMGAQKMILDTLTIKFGGAAKAAGETLPGQMARAKLAFDDVSASIMVKLMPGITAMIGFVNEKVMPAFQRIADEVGPKVAAFFSRVGQILTVDVVPVMRQVAGYIADHVSLFQTLGVALAAIVVAIGVWAAITKVMAIAQAALNLVMTANPIGLVIVALAALAAGLVYAYKHSETFRDIVQGVFKAVETAGSWMWDNVLHPIFTNLSIIWTTTWTAIKGYWDKVGHPMFDGLSAVVAGLGSAFSFVWRGISAVVADVWKVVKPIFDAMVRGVKDVTDAVGKVKGLASGAGLSGLASLVPGGGALKSLLGFAGGTSSAPAGAAWVGENGPELVRFRGGESVTPNSALGGATSVVLNVAIAGQHVGSVIIPDLLAHQRAGGVLAISPNGRPLTGTA